MDLKSEKGSDLKEFLLNNQYKNFVHDYTRIAKSFREKKNKYVTSKTLLDVVIHNSDMITKTETIECPFSDHHFVLATLQVKTLKYENEIENFGRCLSDNNLLIISEELEKSNINQIDNPDIDTMYSNLKNKIMKIVDEHAPNKKFKLKKKVLFPWLDKELREAKELRDYLYHLAHNSKLDEDLHNYKKYRAEYQSLNRAKMKEYFSTKEAKDYEAKDFD